MKKENWALILSVFAFCFSAYAALACDKRIEADWMGILVGILALLVTVLIGWQIYNVVYLEHKIKQLVRNDTMKVEQDMRKGVRNAAIQSNLLMAISYLKVRNWHMLIITFDVLMRDIINNEDKEKAKEIIDMIISLDVFKGLMSEKDIKDLKGLEKRAKGLGKLTDRVFDLMTFLHSL